MINFAEAARLVLLQERVKWATLEAMKQDGHHKSDEAWTNVKFSLPGMFSDDRTPFWVVEIYTYVVGGSRNHEWRGATLAEALALAERDVDRWLMPYEMAAFERAFGDRPDDEHASDCATHNEPAIPNGKCDCKDDDAIAF